MNFFGGGKIFVTIRGRPKKVVITMEPGSDQASLTCCEIFVMWRTLILPYCLEIYKARKVAGKTLAVKTNSSIRNVV